MTNEHKANNPHCACDLCKPIKSSLVKSTLEEMRKYYKEYYNPYDKEQPTANYWGYVLLAEIDALMAENQELLAKYIFMVDSAQQNAKERDQLKERVAKLLSALEEAREELSTVGVPECIRVALAADDEVEGK